MSADYQHMSLKDLESATFLTMEPKFWFWIQMNFYTNPDGPAKIKKTFKTTVCES